MLCLIQSWRLPSPEKFPLGFVSIQFVTGPEVTRNVPDIGMLANIRCLCIPAESSQAGVNAGL